MYKFSSSSTHTSCGIENILLSVHFSQFVINILWFATAQVGNNFEIFIQYSNSPIIQRPELLCKTAGIQIISFYHWAANPCAGQRNGINIFSLNVYRLKHSADGMLPTGKAVLHHGYLHKYHGHSANVLVHLLPPK